MTDGPWSHWVAEPTVEAEPVDELLRQVLIERTDELNLTRSQLVSARRWAVALEQRLAEVRDEIVRARDNGLRYGDLRSRLGERLLALCDAPLEAT